MKLAMLIFSLALVGCGSIAGSMKVSLADDQPLFSGSVELDPKLKKAVKQVCDYLNLETCKALMEAPK